MPSPTSTDFELAKKLSKIADDMNTQIKEVLGKEAGFSLLVFNPEEGGRMQYISNCDREDVVGAMISLIEGWSEGMPDIPAHELH